MVSLLSILLTAAPTWDLTATFTYVKAIYPVSGSDMWCATSGGLFHYDTASGIDQFLSYPEDLPWFDINDMLIDSQGRMWLATAGGGVALQDGSGWDVFTTYEGVPGSGVIHTVESAAGYVWAGSDGGFARGNELGFVPLNESSTGGAFRATEVTDIQCWSDTMWLATDRGVYALDLGSSPFVPSSWRSYEGATLDMGIDGIFADEHGVYGFGGGGVAEKRNSSWALILDYTDEPDSTVFGVAFSGDTLVAGAGGAFWFDGDLWHRWGTSFPANTYASCVEEACGTLWFGMGSNEIVVENFGRGLGYLSGGVWNVMEIPGMANSNCYQMTLVDGRLYLGSHSTGLLAEYPGFGWHDFGFADGMPNTLRVYTACSGYGVGVWTASYHNGLSWLFDNGTFTTEDDTIITFVADTVDTGGRSPSQVVAPLLNNQVRMVCSQGEGFWAAQEAFWQTPDEPSGIVGFSGNPLDGTMAWAPRTEADGLAAPNTRHVYAVGEDSLWIAFESQDGCQLLVHGGDPADSGGDTWYPGPGQSYTVASGLPSNQVFCFAREPGGTILAGTGAGLSRFENGSFTDAYDLTGTVKALQIDDSGAIWCLIPNGIACIENGLTTIYNTLNSDYIPTFREVAEFSMYDPAGGDVYFSSIIGLWRIHTESSYQSGGEALFYPQPWLPAESGLYICGVPAGQEITVSIFSVDGRFLAGVDAMDAESWQWNGVLGGETIASGMYMAIVETADGSVFRARLAVVK